MERLGRKIKRDALALIPVFLLILLLFQAEPVFAAGSQKTTGTEKRVSTVQAAVLGRKITELTAADKLTATADAEEQQWALYALQNHVTVMLAEQSFVYNGDYREPTAYLVFTNEGEQTNVTDSYIKKVTYKNNKKAGKASILVKITGYYSSDGKAVDFEEPIEKTASFEITPKSIEGSKVTLKYDSCTYNGKVRTPAAKVVTKLAKGDTTLVKDKAYTISYSNNKKAGKASVTIKGIGNYKGTITRYFTIQRKNLEKAKVTLNYDTFTYTGSERLAKPTVVLSLDSVKTTLKRDKAYTVVYSKNTTSIGSKIAKIKGIGNYTGEIRVPYQVVPEAGSKLKFTSPSVSSVTVSCKEAKDSKCKYNFQVYTYNESKKQWEFMKNVVSSVNQTTIGGLEAGCGYQVVVTLSKKAGSQTFAGKPSAALKVVTLPVRTVMTSVLRTGEKSLKAAWNGVTSGSGYEVQYSTNDDFSGGKTVTVSSKTQTSVEIKNLATKNAYYVRVRPYKKLGDKVYYGEWSGRMSTGYTNVYASYTTTFNQWNTNRTTNLKLACAAINGTILEPGDVFSFNGVVGERTEAKGYREAIIYEGGQETGGIGGGICQVATTLFNAALKSNCGIVERHQHSLTVHYCPLGYDAAIAWGSKNMRFTNNSGASMKVEMTISGNTLTCRLLTDAYVQPPSVSTSVTVSNGVYTLRRYVDGKCNYTTTSDYLDN